MTVMVVASSTRTSGPSEVREMLVGPNGEINGMRILIQTGME